MHSAPSVVYPVGRCAFHGWMLVVLGVVSGAVGTLFMAGSDFRSFGVWDWLPCVAGVAGWLIWTMWAFLSWLRSPQGTLHWKPQSVEEGGHNGGWSWTDGACSEPLTLNSMERVLDLQGRVLLSCCAQGLGHRWVWVERNRSPARWSDLRRALVSCRA